MLSELVCYRRNKHGKPTGCVIAKKLSDTEVGMGWSKCCKRDQFSKDKAKLIARARAEKARIVLKQDEQGYLHFFDNVFNPDLLDLVPRSMHEVFMKMTVESYIYFLDPTERQKLIDERKQVKVDIVSVKEE